MKFLIISSGLGSRTAIVPSEILIAEEKVDIIKDTRDLIIVMKSGPTVTIKYVDSDAFNKVVSIPEEL